MKKSVKIIIAVLFAAIIIGGAVFLAINPQVILYDIDSVENVGSDIEIVAETVDSVTVKKSSDGDFKVVMFTDLHLGGENKTMNMTLKHYINNIVREKPDLVILGGDNITNVFNKKRTNQFAELMENLGVYWAAVLGNHDGEHRPGVSREEMVKIFSSYDHCLMLSGKEDIDGYGNYTINILNDDGSLKEVFFLMDSGDYMTEELKEKYGVPDGYYDGVKESQVQWYKEKHTEIESEYGEFKSITVVHIPPFQTEEAAANGEFTYGDKKENVCESEFDSGIFRAMKEMGSTQAVYFGHDHINDFGVMYDGILLSYIQSSGYGSYNMENSFGAPEKDWLQGCTILSIKEDGTYTAERFLNHAE